MRFLEWFLYVLIGSIVVGLLAEFGLLNFFVEWGIPGFPTLWVLFFSYFRLYVGSFRGALFTTAYLAWFWYFIENPFNGYLLLMAILLSVLVYDEIKSPSGK